MAAARMKAWEDLKLAIDQYKETTGAEVAAITTCLSEVDYFTQNFILATGKSSMKMNMEVHGHGAIVELVKKFMLQNHHSVVDVDDTTDNVLPFRGGSSFVPTPTNNMPTPKMATPTVKKNVHMGFNVPHSLPTNFMASMKFDTAGGHHHHNSIHQHPLHHVVGSPSTATAGSSDFSRSIIRGNSHNQPSRLRRLPETTTAAADDFHVRGSSRPKGASSGGILQTPNKTMMVNNLNKSPHSKHLHHHQDAGGKRHVSKLSQDLSGVGKDELELDEFVGIIGGSVEDGDISSPNSESDHSSEDDDVVASNLERRRNRYRTMDDDNRSNDHVAASCPININYPSRNSSASASSVLVPASFADNNVSGVAGSLSTSQRHQMSRSRQVSSEVDMEKRPTMETMMAQMQALSRSNVGRDDSSLIFGDRPVRRQRDSLKSFLQQA